MVKQKTQWPRYYGTPEFVCRAAINSLWNDDGSHFFTSYGPQGVLDVRDFAFNVEPLLAEGYVKEVILTLGYICEKFAQEKKITTDIDHQGRVFNAGHPVDTLPLLIYSLAVTKKHCKGTNKHVLQKILDRHSSFLEHEAYLHAQDYFAFPIGRIRLDKSYRTLMRSQKRVSSLYDNCMVAVLARSLDELHMKNPYYGIDFSEIVAHFFWTGAYFKEDQSSSLRITFDANLFPFLFGIITNDELWVAAFASINRIGLENPVPSKFAQTVNYQKLHPKYALDTPYQTSCIWPQLGMLFIRTLADRGDKNAAEHLKAYANIIRQHNNTLEVLQSSGALPYNGTLVQSRHTHLWAVSFLHYAKRFNVE